MANATQVPYELYAPCDQEANVSMCCRTNNGGSDVCLPSGLCRNGNIYWRESCTDPTWTDPACIKLFLNDTGTLDSRFKLEDMFED